MVMSGKKAAPARDTARLLQVRDAALPAFSLAFATVLARFDDVLFDRAETAGASQLLFLDGMRELRRRRQDIVDGHAGHLQRAWEAFAAGAPLSAEAMLAGPGHEELALVDEHELESRLAVRQLAAALLRDFKPVLGRLDRRLGWIGGGLELDADTNPIGPEHLGVAVREAFAGCEFAPDVRLVLIKLCERDLHAPVGRIYASVEDYLARAGIMPDMPAARRAAPPRAATAPPAGITEQPPGGRGHGPPPPAPAVAEGEGGADTGQDMLLEALQALLRQTRHAREDATAAARVAVGQQRPLSQPEMMSVLSLLQATPSATRRAAIGEEGQSLAQRLKGEVLSGATQLGVDPALARLQPQDEDAIDLVGMLFDVMLDERELEGRSRELIGRLVVPFVKVAMLDQRMFVEKAHPARRLLNALAEACEGNTGESQAERLLMGKVEEIIDRLVAEFNENLAIFMTLEEEFRDFLAQHRRRIEIAERRAAETQRGQEKLDMARARSGAELERRIADAALPQAVSEFLRQPWQHHLTLALLREGEDGASVSEALALADGLLAEVAQARRGEGGGRWLHAWQDALSRVFASIGVQDDGAARAIEALHATLRSIAESRPELARGLPDLPQVVLPAAPATEAPVLDVSAAGGEDFDSADAERFGGMQTGTWLDFIDKDGKVQAGKLSWVSPISSRLLFVNRRGVRFCVASPQELAVMVRLGRLRPHVHDGAFDSALQGVIDRLDPKASPTVH